MLRRRLVTSSASTKCSRSTVRSCWSAVTHASCSTRHIPQFHPLDSHGQLSGRQGLPLPGVETRLFVDQQHERHAYGFDGLARLRVTGPYPRFAHRASPVRGEGSHQCSPRPGTLGPCDIRPGGRRSGVWVRDRGCRDGRIRGTPTALGADRQPDPRCDRATDPRPIQRRVHTRRGLRPQRACRPPPATRYQRQHPTARGPPPRGRVCCTDR